MKETHMQDQSPQKNRLYNTFVPTPMTEQKETTIDQMNTPTDIAVEVHHETVDERDRNNYERTTTLAYYTRSRYDNNERGSRSCRSPDRSYRSPYRRASRPR